MSKKNIKVAVRIRPFLPQDNDKVSDEQLLQMVGKNSLRLPLPTRERPRNNNNNNVAIDREEKVFSFDYVFKSNSTQLDVYKETGMKNLVAQVLEGYNATIFAYGHTGSGKTHTVVGDISKEKPLNEDASGNHHGIISRAAEAIFAALEKDGENNPDQTVVKCTYIQIYNESAYDLLSTDFRNSNSSQFTSEKALKLRWSSDIGFFLENVFEVTVSSFDDWYRLFKRGTENRVFASNQLNLNSSRSHCILSLILEKKRKIDESVMVVASRSRLRFVDLAGSERVTVESSETSMKESISINKSLHVLRKVVVALASGHDGQSHIPYRDSMLTSILQHSFGGNCVTLMIACLSPGNSFIQENMSTMRYASLASRIRNYAVINVDPTHRLITKLKKTVARLQQKVVQLEQNSSLSASISKFYVGEEQDYTDRNKRIITYFNSAEKNFINFKNMQQVLIETQREKMEMSEEMDLLLKENNMLKQKNRVLSHKVFSDKSNDE